MVLFWQADLSKPPDAQLGLPEENDSWLQVLRPRVSILLNPGMITMMTMNPRYIISGIHLFTAILRESGKNN
jgi:hypothetical protein